MEYVQCKNGHFYDPSKFSEDECPECKKAAANNSGETISMDMGNPMYQFGGHAFPMGETEDIFSNRPLQMKVSDSNATKGMFPETENVFPNAQPTYYRGEVQDNGKTVGNYPNKLGIDPVVGWLVCVDGKEKGRDYRIHSDINFVGRDKANDICIGEDETISRVKHLSIAYDTRGKIFYISPGDGRNISYLNNSPVLGVVKLEAFDEILIGRTKLIFIPLCGERFDWNND